MSPRAVAVLGALGHNNPRIVGGVAIELVVVEAVDARQSVAAKHDQPSALPRPSLRGFVGADHGRCLIFVVSDPVALLCPEFGEQRHCAVVVTVAPHKGNGAPQPVWLAGGRWRAAWEAVTAKSGMWGALAPAGPMCKLICGADSKLEGDRMDQR